MNTYKPTYQSLNIYLRGDQSIDPTIRTKWMQLEHSLGVLREDEKTLRASEGVLRENEDTLRDYAVARHVCRRAELPPVFFFTREQKQLYRQVFPQIQDSQYIFLAAQILGVP